MSSYSSVRALTTMHPTDYLEKVRAMCTRYDDRYIARYIGIAESEVARIRASLTNIEQGRPSYVTRGLSMSDKSMACRMKDGNWQIREATEKLGAAIEKMMQRQSAGA
jgi:hypothetical protein